MHKKNIIILIILLVIFGIVIQFIIIIYIATKCQIRQLIRRPLLH